MRELFELQTGQVAFISGLLAGFSLSVAVNILRHGIRSWLARGVFVLFLLTSLLFLVALYVDVRLSIALAGLDAIPDAVLGRVTAVRNIGTACATLALFLFIAAIGLLSWLARPFAGVLGTLLAAAAGALVWYVRAEVGMISGLLG